MLDICMNFPQVCSRDGLGGQIPYSITRINSRIEMYFAGGKWVALHSPATYSDGRFAQALIQHLKAGAGWGAEGSDWLPVFLPKDARLEL
jgi:hypothetical protein